MNSIQSTAEADSLRAQARDFFSFDNYKELLLAKMRVAFGEKRGQFRRVAEVLNVHPTMVTHVFRDESHLTPDQAIRLATHLGFSDSEKAYLLHLVLRERAADPESRRYFTNRLEALRARARKGSTSLEEEASYFPQLSSWQRTIEALNPLRGQPTGNSREKSLRLFRWLSRHCGDTSSDLTLLNQKNWRCFSENRIAHTRCHETAVAMPLLLNPERAGQLQARIRQLVDEAKSLGSEPGPNAYCLTLTFHDLDPAQEHSPEVRKDCGKQTWPDFPVSH